MLYIIEVPETRMRDLSTCLVLLNPDAAPPIPVGMDENNHVGTIAAAQDTYQDEIRELIESPKEWEDLAENTRMAIAAHLAGFINWQFDWGHLNHWETLPDLLKDHPEIGRMR